MKSNLRVMFFVVMMIVGLLGFVDHLRSYLRPHLHLHLDQGFPAYFFLVVLNYSRTLRFVPNGYLLQEQGSYLGIYRRAYELFRYLG